VIPAVQVHNCSAVLALAHAHAGAVYCLGIHPLYVEQAQPDDLQVLRTQIQACLDDPLFAGVGEIGLDGFVPHLNRDKQVTFFHAQLKMAVEFGVPVVMHVRKAQDDVLKGLRRYQPKLGIAHAFNGSFQQAEQFLKLGIRLGFGGACSFDRALQLRRLVSELPAESIVLETDGPDIAPAWIYKQRNEPMHLARIATVIADLREMELEALATQTQLNAEQALPALTTFSSSN
jgi:TatD DNase family protein